jgi:hypothetical protein
MKHILPIITLTTLTAAAFADAGAAAPAAAASGLSYNRVTVAQYTDGQTDRSISVANLINGSNVLVTLGQNTGANNGANNDAEVSVGYVFKNVISGIDATAGLSSGTEDAVTVDLRRSLSEVVAGLEVGLGYSHASKSDGGTSWSYEVSYNINKQFSVAFGADDVDGLNLKAVALRYNY